MYGDELLTVVVPIYNTPLYVFEKCIESIFFQKYQMLDVGVIDDGSEEILSQEYEAIVCKFPNRIRLLKNSGYHLHAISDWKKLWAVMSHFLIVMILFQKSGLILA